MSNTIPGDAHAMIIGAMKCGTSSLYDYLRGHPEICPSIIKEPEFFSEHQGHGVEVEDYHCLFSFDGAVHKYALEASTGYTKYPKESNVPKNIFEYGISPRFIYIIRDPFERIQSHFNYMRRNEKWSLDMVDDHLIDTCNYFLQLERYRRYFPIDDILVLDFDDLKRNPSGVLENVYDFLGLSHDYFPESYEVKNSTRPVSRIERGVKKLGVHQLLRPLPRTPRRVIKAALDKVLPAEKRKLTDAEREFVYSRLKDSMLGLNEVYGFDSRKWGFCC
ncbi:hypothetical protein EQG41_18555 [Billgrantia azerbaijanica]|nr:hypothetical protein EQG41_18555 [Halomonas azerbaijanica]